MSSIEFSPNKWLKNEGSYQFLQLLGFMSMRCCVLWTFNLKTNLNILFDHLKFWFNLEILLDLVGK